MGIVKTAGKSYLAYIFRPSDSKRIRAEQNSFLAQRMNVRVNGEIVPYEMRRGYCLIRRVFKTDTIHLNLSMPVLQVEANPQVRENDGMDSS